MRKVASLIVRLLREGDEAVPQVKEQVIELCQRFPLYPEL